MAQRSETGLASVCAAFGVGELLRVRRVARGAMGAVWRIDTGPAASASFVSPLSGSSRASSSAPATYAAKELFWEVPDDDAVHDEVQFAALCRQAGVANPRALATPHGAYLVRDPAGRAWRLYEWIDGHVPDRTDVSAVTWLARQLGRVHAITVPPGDDAEPDPFYHRLDVDWDELASAVARAGLSWLPQLEAVLDRLLDLSKLVNGASNGPMVRCHRDPKMENVLVEQSGRRWLVDWDNSGAMAPERELGLLLTVYLDDDETLAAASAEYRHSGGVARLDGPEGFATGVAAWLNFLHVQARRLLDPDATPDHQRFAAAQVIGLLRDIPTIGQLEHAAGIVDAPER